MTMVSQADLDRLLAAMRTTGTIELEIASGEEHLRLVLPPGPVATTVTEMPPPIPARSPAIGHWLARGAGDGLLPLAVGEPVLSGEALGYVLLGPLRWIVVAPEAGEVIDAGPDDGTLVGHGDPVVKLRSLA
jgi:hypothetical protein